MAIENIRHPPERLNVAVLESVGENRQPRSPEWTACQRADDFNVHLGMVDVADLKGAIPMARRGWLQLEIEFRVSIVCSPALPLQRLLERWALADGKTE